MADLVGKAKTFLAEKVANIKKPEADLSDLDVKQVSGDSVIFQCKVAVTNPYDHSIPICEISYAFKSANRQITSGTLPDPGSLAANETTMLEIPVKVLYSALVSLMRDLGRDWDLDYQLDVGLTVDLPIVGNFTIPLSKKGEVKLPTLSDVI